MLSTRADIIKALENETVKYNERDIVFTDSKLISFILDNAEMIFENDIDFYLGKDLLHIMNEIYYSRRRKAIKKMKDDCEETVSFAAGIETRCYDGGFDFGHVAPDMEAVLSLGIPGLRARAAQYAKKHIGKPKSECFFAAVDAVYSSAEGFLLRGAEKARAEGRGQLSETLSALSRRAPETLFEAIQLIFVIYILIMCEGTAVRTLGRLDSLLQPYFEHDIREGIHTKESAMRLISGFIAAMDSYKIPANLPFAIGGNRGGKTLVCEMSYILLKSYIALKPPYTKIHFLYDKNTPETLVRLAFEGIREGANSIVFLCDRTVQKALLHVGADRADVEAYTVVGCYECGAADEVTCSCGGRLNIVKALESALFGGRELSRSAHVGALRSERDHESFDALLEAFYGELKHFSEAAMAITDCHEKYYPQLHSSPFFSSTYISSLENGGDIYCHNSARYTNTSINALGLASAADSLLAIRKAVYEDKLVTLSELKEILRSDWEGNEELRLLIKNKYPKYGMGDPESDRIAGDIMKALDSFITGKPNKKGGIYRFGTFSIDWRVDYGRYTGASANGRKRGEMLSLNTGASLGADRAGVTAHILSAAGCGGCLTPNGSVLDVDLHATAVVGEAGLSAMLATLCTYEENGGFAVHYNVLDTAVLRDAQINPEKYPNLQVRLCGWNALFTSLDKLAQDDFIERAENKQ